MISAQVWRVPPELSEAEILGIFIKFVINSFRLSLDKIFHIL